MVNNYTKCQKGVKKMKDTCDIINLGHCLLDLISDILDCDCKDKIN